MEGNNQTGDIIQYTKKDASNKLKLENWIENGIDRESVEYAKAVGEYLASPEGDGAKNGEVTSTRIRNIYNEVVRIKMKGYEKEKASFILLKPKMAYMYARDKSSSSNEGLTMLKWILDLCCDKVNDQKTFLNFCNLFESILAYHKYYSSKKQR